MLRLNFPSLAVLSGAALALTLTGCKKPQIRVYTVAHEQPAAPVTPPPSEPPLARASNEDAAPHARPHLDYKLPAVWKDVGSSEFSLVNFKISTAEGTAMVNITPLAGMAGNDAAIVNLWRQQLGEPVLDNAAAVASLTTVEVGGEQGKFFELSGKRDGQTQRIITAFVHRPDGSWFYKLQGDDAVVTAQKVAFLDFLKTVKITPGNPTETAAVENKAPAEDATPAVHMVAPQGWEAQPPGQMQVAKFTVNKDGGKADISVSVFSSDTGGTLANVNRWRRMLGLNDVDEAGLQECTSKLGDATIDGAPEAVLADLSNDNRRLLGAIVPREGRWWFYKMVGDAPAVNAEHDTFVQFVKAQP